MDRRKFIINIGRAAILAGIGIVAGKSLLNKNTQDPCRYVYLCKGCNKLSQCGLDEAVRYRNELKRK